MRHSHVFQHASVSTLFVIVSPALAMAAEQRDPIPFENERCAWSIAPDATLRRFADRPSGKNYAAAGAPVARIRRDGKEYVATEARPNGARVDLTFGDSGVRASLRIRTEPRHFVCTVESVSDQRVDELTFIDLALTLQGGPDEAFAACALARNLQANVAEMPRPVGRLRAMCYPRFGMTGASVAIVACPASELRDALKDAVTGAPDLPHSSIGGPWAMDAPINRGSYLFNFGGLSEETVDQWIEVARRTGMNQIDFHGGSSFRFGDIRPNPQTYPNGTASLKAVVDRLHAAGIAAGLHTYAFFLDKQCKWVSPVPDPRLAKDATFTLADDLPVEAARVPVVESTEKMSTVTGFFVWNSVTLQIDDELITYAGVGKTAPYAFTECKRGAWGTKPAAHARGAKVHHLKECFGLFVPDGDSTLFSEVAARTAEVFNECGFDMMYLDALDGEGIIGGPEAGWHYGSKFVYEIWKHLKRPALMEMSTFHHHLWCVRSRYGAWDHPNRGHKRFVDVHCEANREAERMFLPAHLGWWAVKTWGGLQDEPTYADDIEYLCGKAIGNGIGLSMMGVNPETIRQVPAYERLSGIMRRYEELRRSGQVPESVRTALQKPGDGFTLEEPSPGTWRFRRVRYDRHKVEGLQHSSRKWAMQNGFGAQPLRVRIEGLLSPVAYDAKGTDGVADLRQAGGWKKSTASGLSIDVAPEGGEDMARVKVAGSQPAGGTRGWARLERTYDPLLNLRDREGLGVWVEGDGSGAVLNVQLRSPEHLSRGVADHYIPLDFTGRRYFELMELDNPAMSQYAWPHAADPYLVYREMVHYDKVESLSVWVTNLPPGKTLACGVGPIRALPLVTPPIVNPAVTVGGKTVTFPVTIETGCYLEFNSPDDCTLYARDGKVLQKVTPRGEVPTLAPGENNLQFQCEPPAVGNARTYVTIISLGETVR